MFSSRTTDYARNVIVAKLFHGDKLIAVVRKIHGMLPGWSRPEVASWHSKEGWTGYSAGYTNLSDPHNKNEHSSQSCNENGNKPQKSWKSSQQTQMNQELSATEAIIWEESNKSIIQQFKIAKSSANIQCLQWTYMYSINNQSPVLKYCFPTKKFTEHFTEKIN